MAARLASRTSQLTYAYTAAYALRTLAPAKEAVAAAAAPAAPAAAAAAGIVDSKGAAAAETGADEAGATGGPSSSTSAAAGGGRPFDVVVLGAAAGGELSDVASWQVGKAQGLDVRCTQRRCTGCCRTCLLPSTRYSAHSVPAWGPHQSTRARGNRLCFYTEFQKHQGPVTFLRQLAYNAVVLRPARQVLADALPGELMERCGLRLLFVGPEVPDSLAGSTLEVGAMHMHFVQVGSGHAGGSREAGVPTAGCMGST